MYKEIITKILENISDELKNKDTIDKCSKEIIEPIIQNTIQSIYPYIISFIVVIILIFVIILCILFLNIKVCYKIK